MPRTAVFYKTLEDAFGDRLCPIEQSPADELEGGILTVDGLEGTPFACKSLLRWMDQTGTNPLTRLPLTVDMLHPVMTRRTDKAAYARMVGSLARRGWEGQAEIEDDMRQRSGAKRTREGEMMTNAALDAMRAGIKLNLWVLFEQSLVKSEAMRYIDSVRLHPTGLLANKKDAMVASDMYERIDRFIKHRKNLWRFPDNESDIPVYLDALGLANDFMVLYPDTYLHGMNGVLRMIESVATKSASDNGYWNDHVIARTDYGRLTAIVVSPPSITEWLRNVILPGEVDLWPERWRQPPASKTIANRLWTRTHDVPTQFEFTPLEIEEALAQFMTRTENVRFYSLPVGPFDAADVDARLHEAIALCVDDDRTLRLLKPPIDFVPEIRAHLPDFMDDAPTDAEICAAVERHFDVGHATGYYLAEEDLRRVVLDPRWLPSDPYTNPALLSALKHGLEWGLPDYD